MAATTIESLGLRRVVCVKCLEDTFIAEKQRRLCIECGTHSPDEKKKKAHMRSRIDGSAHIGMWPKRRKK